MKGDAGMKNNAGMKGDAGTKSQATMSGQAPYQVPFITRLNRLWVRPLFRGVFHLLSQVSIHGKENIPAKGPYIAAMNHLSIFDPPFIGAFWRTELEPVGAVEVWSKPGQGIIVNLYGGIQVRRGEYDRQAIDRMLAALSAGLPLLIAPEGGRSHEPGLRRAKPGIAYIVNKTGVPVVPVAMVGTTDDFLTQAFHSKRPRLEMYIGKLMHLPPVTGKGAEKRLALQRNADQVMFSIADLLPPEYRGVYANPDSNTFESA